jgi:tetratricopeptide (TPR) repeat protein
LCIDFTLAHPERVTRLVLIGSVVSGMSYTEHMFTRGGRITAEIYGDRDRLAKYIMTEDPYEIYPGNTAARERAWAIARDNMQNFKDANNHLARPPDRPALPNLGEIKIPTLVVAGEYDIPDVHALTGAIQAGIPGARRIVIPNSGHLVPLEQPEALADAVTAFLQVAEFRQVLENDGAAAAADYVRNFRAEDAGADLIAEGRLNAVGYELLMKEDAAAAVEILRLNVELHPHSANAYDSYGEALLAAGDTARAVTNYKKSLELNPDNTNARTVLERLGR